MVFLLEAAERRGAHLDEADAALCEPRAAPRQNALAQAGHGKAYSVQRAIYVRLFSREFGTSLTAALTPHVCACLALFSDARPDAATVSDRIDACARALRKGSGIFFLYLARTWCGAWATAHRLQKGSSPCVWGCSPAGRDSLAHMLQCPALWEPIARCLQVRITDPLSKIGLGTVGRGDKGGPAWPVLGVAIAAQAYHRRQERIVASPSEGRRWAAAEVEFAYRQLSVLR